MNTGLFQSGWDFSQWTPIDWVVAITAGFALGTSFSAFRSAYRRLK